MRGNLRVVAERRPRFTRGATSSALLYTTQTVRTAEVPSDVVSTFARSLRLRSTRAETRVWRWLRNRRMFGLKFRRQHPVGNYVLDFYCPELRLCVEIDGTAHDTFASAMHDAERACDLSRLGIEVVRVRNEHVFEQPVATWEFIVGAVVKALCERTGQSENEVLRQLHGPSP